MVAGIDVQVNEKMWIVIICVMGLAGVFYGMLRGNNVVFCIGILTMIGGYLLIRKRLKQSLKEKE